MPQEGIIVILIAYILLTHLPAFFFFKQKLATFNPYHSPDLFLLLRKAHSSWVLCLDKACCNLFAFTSVPALSTLKAGCLKLSTASLPGSSSVALGRPVERLF